MVSLAIALAVSFSASLPDVFVALLSEPSRISSMRWL